jgi:DNA-binding MarR family transcriptional regulator
MNHFRRIVRALRSSHRAAGHLNLTGAQLFVINVIGEAGGPLSVNEVAQRTGTDQSTVSVVTNRLVERGLLKRQRSRIDSRRVELSLTASGRALQKKAPVTIAQQRMTAALFELSSRDAAELLRLLEKIVSSMNIGAERAGMMFDDVAPESPAVDPIPLERIVKRTNRAPRKR